MGLDVLSGCKDLFLGLNKSLWSERMGKRHLMVEVVVDGEVVIIREELKAHLNLLVFKA